MSYPHFCSKGLTALVSIYYGTEAFRVAPVTGWKKKIRINSQYLGLVTNTENRRQKINHIKMKLCFYNKRFTSHMLLIFCRQMQTDFTGRHNYFAVSFVRPVTQTNAWPNCYNTKGHKSAIKHPNSRIYGRYAHLQWVRINLFKLHLNSVWRFPDVE